MALDQWCNLINVGIESFEKSRVLYAAYKGLVHKGKQGPTPGPQSHHINWEICGKLLLLLASLKSDIRIYVQPAAPLHYIHVNKSDQQCPVW